MKTIEGGVCAPQGFTASGVAAGIKPGSTKKDCALIASDRDAEVAGVFTTNVLKAPPVLWNQSVCERGTARAVFLNSGCANAATGRRGMQDVKATLEHVGEALGVPADRLCACSTGVIGVVLPMDRIRDGATRCVGALSRDGSADAAAAIMTTDTVAKFRAIELEIEGAPVRLGAIAKGAGMISPDMATMLSVVTTDASFAPNVLPRLLREAVELSFNRVSVDNDMSTSDTVLMLANGASAAAPIQSGTPEYEVFAEALRTLCRDMAWWLVRDGEGATKFVKIEVRGTESDHDAKTIARSIGHSQLCKTAFFGEDPNWGRFACAAGYAGVDFDPAELTIALEDVVLCRDGLVAAYKEADAAAIMKRDEFTIRVSVGEGEGHAEFWTSDLSHEYVSINADYRT